VARSLASQLGSPDALLAAEWETLLAQKAATMKENTRRRTRGEPPEPVALEGIGPEIVASVSAFLAEAHNRKVIDDLRALGVEPVAGEAAAGATAAARVTGGRAGATVPA